MFMKRVEDNADWTLMCPAEFPGLDEVWGEEFEKLYERYGRFPDKRAKVKIIFLISQPKRMLWVLKRTVSMRQYD